VADAGTGRDSRGVGCSTSGYAETLRAAVQKSRARRVLSSTSTHRFILPDGRCELWKIRNRQASEGPAGYADYGLQPNAFGYAQRATRAGRGDHEGCRIREGVFSQDRVGRFRFGGRLRAHSGQRIGRAREVRSRKRCRFASVQTPRLSIATFHVRISKRGWMMAARKKRPRVAGSNPVALALNAGPRSSGGRGVLLMRVLTAAGF